ncbi:MAG: radical SAM protein [Candidatus Diapherotrites archaeon]|nr:radical SAM protein [Candidatus Diapherotrites archaeon]
MRNFYHSFFEDKNTLFNPRACVPSKLIEELKNFAFKPAQGLRKVKETKNAVFLHDFLLNRVYWIEKDIFERTQSFSGKIDSEIDYNLLKAGLLEEKTHSYEPKCSNSKPDTLSIFPTTGCNLNCIYCYANAGINTKKIDMAFVRAGIDWFLTNCQKTIPIVFHGGGEPTTAMEIIKESQDYARSKADNVFLSASTNGVFPEKTLEYILENFDNITVSCDGPPEIQNRQRPQRNGDKSSNIVEETLKRFSESDFSFSVRSTVTEYSCAKQNDMVEYFRNLGCRNIHFEPMFENSKSSRHTVSYSAAPEYHKFVNNFLKARELSDEYGMNLHCSYLPVGRVVDKFCKAAGGNFCLTPDGFISSCYEAPSGNDSETNDFIYGYFDKNKQSIELNDEKLLKLKNRTIEKLTDCRSCNFRYGCAGFCLSKTLFRTRNLNKPDPKLCETIKNLGDEYLNLFFEKNVKKMTPYLIEDTEGKNAWYQLSTQKIKINEITEFSKTKNNESKILSVNFESLVSKNTENAKEIINLKPNILLVLIPDSTHINKDSYSKFKESKKEIEKNNIIVKLTKPLPYCITKEKMPSFPCAECLELFKAKPDGTIVFCNALKINPKKISDFETRSDLTDFVQKTTEDQNKKNGCLDCIYLIRGKCGGKCQKIQIKNVLKL